MAGYLIVGDCEMGFALYQSVSILVLEMNIRKASSTVTVTVYSGCVREKFILCLIFGKLLRSSSTLLV